LSSRLAETLETEQLLSRMARVLAEGTGAREAEVWLKVGNGLRLAAAWPSFTETITVALAGEELPSLGESRHAVPVLHRGELLGALALNKPDALTQTEEKLVTDLAAQAGLVMRNVSLTAELMLRLEELRLSRQRLVAASNDPRRQIERNIHDGAQQQLVAMMVRLNLAERVAEKEAPKVHEMLSQIKAEAVEALENLRDLARGIYPPLLASNGLAAALEAQARKVPLDVTVSCDGVGRYDQETEAAIYFCCLEALQNVAKSAHATRGSVRLHQDQGRLHFEVEDDGVGFDPASSTRGAGLQNMIDRVEALSGTLLIDSAPGRGTRIGGWVPAPHPPG
jgi:signal transduction histidine kinase